MRQIYICHLVFGRPFRNIRDPQLIAPKRTHS
ncbi:hypothetical protein THICB1_70367 [Thiomonas arsenitoxydans]|uniref:Uncharacterized protein n=1 Tax=Thiomonas arsenitoxydans (strain DSM 22701 / CIP 110005 / 3As) TaxID=426114 RepID=A0ABM9T8Q1_THIA3|nr:hypothetical protein THICB1_70367 [Thiomonas arsenitoxydans]CQR39189.1 hypothetical protein THICB6_60372 [Thiomonas arsenitoxydans]